MALSYIKGVENLELAGKNSPIIVELNEDNPTNYGADFFGIHLQVQDSGGTQIGAEMRQENQNAQFDISEYFRSKNYDDFNFPENLDDLITKRNALRYSYKLRRSIKKGNPLVESEVSTTATFFVLYGGLSYPRQQLNAENGVTFWDRLQSEKFFLTNAPNNKITDAYANEKLYYYVFNSLSSIKLQVEGQYEDGTSLTEYTAETQTGTAQNDIYEITCSFSALGLIDFEITAGKKLKYYEVWIEAVSNAEISERRRFYIDRTKYEFRKDFIFLNDFMVPECIRTTGLQTIAPSVEREEGVQIIEWDAEPTQPKNFITDLIEQVGITMNMGFLKNKEWSIYMFRALLNSRQVWFIENDYIYPVIITSKGSSPHKDKRGVYSGNVSMKLANSNAWQDDFTFRYRDLFEYENLLEGWDNGPLMSWTTFIVNGVDLDNLYYNSGSYAQCSSDDYIPVTSGEKIYIEVNVGSLTGSIEVFMGVWTGFWTKKTDTKLITATGLQTIELTVSATDSSTQLAFKSLSATETQLTATDIIVYRLDSKNDYIKRYIDTYE